MTTKRTRPTIDADPDQVEAFVRGGAKKSYHDDTISRDSNTIEQRAREALERDDPRAKVVVSFRLRPETVQRLDLLSKLRKRAGRPNAGKQAIAEEALAGFLPDALGELLE